MQSTQGNILLSLQNVQRYLCENATALGDVISAETRAELVARQRVKRAALVRDHMALIARIAKHKLENAPELVALTMPRHRPTAERLAALANGMASAAEPFADVFVRAGCKPEFVQDLRAAADALLQTLHDGAHNRGMAREATSDLRIKLSRAQGRERHRRLPAAGVRQRSCGPRPLAAREARSASALRHECAYHHDDRRSTCAAYGPGRVPFQVSIGAWSVVPRSAL